MRIALALALLLPMVGSPDRVEGWCCLCMCKSLREDHCSLMCRQLQHSNHIIELPEMERCTRKCEKYGVRQIPQEWLNQYLEKQ
jgi:hypothetical protein